MGELSNNCFDHNLGYWEDQPGCCISWTFENSRVTFAVADRGRGIVRSLRNVAGSDKTSQQILNMAFEKVISGRAPESRGNGLKFVRKAVESSSKNGLACFANGCIYLTGQIIPPAITDLPRPAELGTLTYVQWSL